MINLRKLMVFLVALLLATAVFAFGGRGGKSRKQAVYQGTGVDSIGIHVGGKTGECPEHSSRRNGTCTCDAGWTPNLDGECVTDECSGFKKTDCAVKCDPLTGEITYANSGTSCGTGKVCDGSGSCNCISGYLEEGSACYPDACADFEVTDCVTACSSSGGKATYTYATLCNGNKYLCNDTHECVNPCDGQSYGECQVCTPTDGQPVIGNKPNSATCGSNGSYICQNGTCKNPCDGQSYGECQICTPRNGHAEFSNKSNTATCGNGGNYICQNGTCSNPCNITPHDSECQICTASAGHANLVNEPNTKLCGANGNYICQNGSCTNPCNIGTHPVSDCTPGWIAQNGVCKPRYIEEGEIVNHKVCDGAGGYTCEEGYELYEDKCVRMCLAEQKCGESCCSDGHTCQNGQCCDEEGNCCNSSGFDPAAQKCCKKGTYLVTSEEYGSGYATTHCCPEDSPGYGPANGRCCNADEKVMGFWCCSSDTVAFSPATGCCAPDKAIEYLDDLLMCCGEGSSAYCTQRDDEGKCIGGSCCGGKITKGAGVNGVDICCWDGGYGYCEVRDEDGVCVLGSSYGNAGSCCRTEPQQVGNDTVCCSDGQTASCARFDDESRCTVGACCPEGQTPYCSVFYGYDGCNGQCCSGTVYRNMGRDGSDLCCQNGQTFTCAEYDENENCLIGACCSGDQSATCSLKDDEGKCLLAVCCGEGQQGYHPDKGDGSCCSDTVFTNVSDTGLDACCPADAAPYCAGYNFSTYGCDRISCCTGTVHQGMGDYGIDLCCLNGQNFSCADHDADSGECIIGACCPEGQSAECAVRDEDGQCIRAICCSDDQSAYFRYGDAQCCVGSVYQPTPYNGICCADGYEPYCSSGNAYGCYGYDCCAGTLYRGIGSNYTDLCCKEDQALSCAEYDTNGNCVRGSCCPEGKVATCYASDSYNDCSATICCDEGQEGYYNRGYGKCCSDTVYKNVRDSGQDLCCKENEKPYCLGYNFSDYGCNEVGCCAGTLYEGIGEGGTDLCCAEGEELSCFAHDEDGNCTLGICCPVGSSAECSAQDEDGECIKAQCCGDVGGRNMCCPANQTPYCGGMSGNYCYSSNCCPNSSTIYCSYQYADGSCSSYRCCSGNPYLYGKEGETLRYDCCYRGTIVEFEGLEACCTDSSSTPYCRERNSDGTCRYTSCCDGSRTVTEIDGVGACCSNEETPYCESKNSDGTCRYASCCLGNVTEFGDRAVCCSSTATPYIYYNSGYQNLGCCDSSRTLTEFGEVSACCGVGETPYCSNVKSDGTCYGTSCCYNGSTPYCNYEENGVCKSYSCCNGAIYLNSSSGNQKWYSCCSNGGVVSEFEGQNQCCYNGETPYCSGRNSNGSCYSASCCPGEVYKGYKYNGADLCCKYSYGYTGVYCTDSDSQGNCRNYECCAGTLYEGYGRNGSDLCCAVGNGYTSVYCVNKDSNGECIEHACCNGTVYEGSGSNGTDLCCSTGEEMCCAKYDAQGKCILGFCSTECPSCGNNGYSTYDGVCCESGTVSVPLRKDETICCPSGSTGFSTNSWECCSSYQQSYIAYSEGNDDYVETSCCSGTVYRENSSEDWYRQGCCESGNVTNFGNIGICCENGATGYVYHRDGNYVETDCCSSSWKVTDLGQVSSCCPRNGTGFIEYKSGDYMYTNCCEAGSTPYVSYMSENGNYIEAGCCDETVIRTDEWDDGYSQSCCPTGSVGVDLDGECCEAGNKIIQDDDGEKHCCPKNSTRFDRDAWECI